MFNRFSPTPRSFSFARSLPNNLENPVSWGPCPTLINVRKCAQGFTNSPSGVRQAQVSDVTTRDRSPLRRYRILSTTSMYSYLHSLLWHDQMTSSLPEWRHQGSWRPLWCWSTVGQSLTCWFIHYYQLMALINLLWVITQRSRFKRHPPPGMEDWRQEDSWDMLTLWGHGTRGKHRQAPWYNRIRDVFAK